MGDLCSVLAIVHQQQVNLPDVIDQELLQPAGEKVSCLRLRVRFMFGCIFFDHLTDLLVAAISDLTNNVKTRKQ